VLGVRAAAAPDHPHADLEESPRVHAEVLGRGEVDAPPVEQPRVAGVRRDRHRLPLRGGDEPLGDREQLVRSHAAVRADHVRAPLEQHLGGARRAASVADARLLVEAPVRRDRQAGRAPRRLHCDAHLDWVADRLDRQEVDAALGQRRHLLGERVARLVLGIGRRERRRRQEPGGPDRAGHVGVVSGNVARDGRGRAVHVAHLLAEPVTREPRRAGAEGVGLDDLRAGAEIVAVHRAHQIRLGEIHLVEVVREEDAALVQLRSHRAVADERPSREDLEKRQRGGHGPRNITRRSGPGKEARVAPRRSICYVAPK
jgi:hypothetical protein